MIVTLVHGTWARDAAWTKVTSALSTFLLAKFEPLRITQLEWSGGNSHAARMDGAVKLRRHILKWKSESPRERQIIIAHSHGGNVAMYALRDEEAAAAVRGVVCLSTPYLFCRSRDLGEHGVRSVIGFSFWSIVALAFFIPAILLGFLAVWLGSAWEITSACLMIVASLLGIIGMFLVATPGIANWLVLFCAISFGFFPFIFLSLICVMTCSFGKDTGLIASFFEITCESAPPGNANVHILTNQQKHDLWHSVPYQSPAAFTAIENWINSIVVRKSGTPVVH